MASASDGGSPPQTATATIYINVIDVNDNAPDLDRALYSVSVPEDAPTGTTLERILASDADEVSEGRLRFQVEEPFDELFSVTPEGDLVTVAALDREKEAAYAFRVTVSDDGPLDYPYGGVASRITDRVFTSTCLVEVTVSDVNDVAPSFEEDSVSASVSENAPAGTSFAKVAARDADEGRNAEVHYFLEDSYSSRFSVGRVDGVLRSEAPLDREEREQYKLAVVATDNGSPR